MSNGDDTMPRITTASVDRRVERLEETVNHLQESYNELDRKVDRVEIGQQHLKELLDAKLATHDSKLDQLNLKLDNLLSGFAEFKIEMTRQSGDVTATPAGRVVSDEIEELKKGRSENAEGIKKLSERIVFVGGGLAVVMFLINLLSPVILAALNLPH